MFHSFFKNIMFEILLVDWLVSLPSLQVFNCVHVYRLNIVETMGISETAITSGAMGIIKPLNIKKFNPLPDDKL